MDQRFRRGFTAAEKTELWDRWQRGEDGIANVRFGPKADKRGAVGMSALCQ